MANHKCFFCGKNDSFGAVTIDVNAVLRADNIPAKGQDIQQTEICVECFNKDVEGPFRVSNK